MDFVKLNLATFYRQHGGNSSILNLCVVLLIYFLKLDELELSPIVSVSYHFNLLNLTLLFTTAAEYQATVQDQHEIVELKSQVSTLNDRIFEMQQALSQLTMALTHPSPNMAMHSYPSSPAMANAIQPHYMFSQVAGASAKTANDDLSKKRRLRSANSNNNMTYTNMMQDYPNFPPSFIHPNALASAYSMHLAQHQQLTNEAMIHAMNQASGQLQSNNNQQMPNPGGMDVIDEYLRDTMNMLITDDNDSDDENVGKTITIHSGATSTVTSSSNSSEVDSPQLHGKAIKVEGIEEYLGYLNEIQCSDNSEVATLKRNVSFAASKENKEEAAVVNKILKEHVSAQAPLDISTFVNSLNPELQSRFTDKLAELMAVNLSSMLSNTMKSVEVDMTSASSTVVKTDSFRIKLMNSCPSPVSDDMSIDSITFDPVVYSSNKGCVSCASNSCDSCPSTSITIRNNEITKDLLKTESSSELINYLNEESISEKTAAQAYQVLVEAEKKCQVITKTEKNIFATLMKNFRKTIFKKHSGKKGNSTTIISTTSSTKSVSSKNIVEK